MVAVDGGDRELSRVLDDAGLPPACIREGWWMAHISRTFNGCADRFAKQACIDMCPMKIQIFDQDRFLKFTFRLFVSICG